jgi:hypothetical protein
VAAGYPYYVDGQITVGAGKIGNVAFDAGVLARSFVARTELGGKVRFTLVDRDPFSMALFGHVGFGSNLIDDSARNSVFGDVGGLLSLTAFGNVTVTGRVYANIWSDRHCPTMAELSRRADALEVCTNNGAISDTRLGELGFDDVSDLYEREVRTRIMFSAIAEIAIWQRWSLWLMGEGAPLQGERAAFTNPFSGTMFNEDIGTYVRVGGTFKF